MKIYIISLKRHSDRVIECTKKLEELNLNYEIFPAIDGWSLSKEEQSLCKSEDVNIFRLYKSSRQISINGKLTPSEQGCALSHLKLYQKIIDNNDDYAVILEDDALVNTSFKVALESIHCIKEEWDVINLTNHLGIKNLPFSKKYYFGESSEYYFSRVGMHCPFLDSIFNARRLIALASAYIITPKACKRLIEIGYPVRIPADFLLGCISINGLKTFRSYPVGLFVDTNSFETTMTESERDKHIIHRL